MSVTYEDVGTDLRRIAISGRLDMAGTQAVAPQLADYVATPRKRVIVDISAVEVLGSVGIRALIENAKVVQRRGGRMSLVVDADSIVILSLRATGIDELIPTYTTMSEAQAAILG